MTATQSAPTYSAPWGDSEVPTTALLTDWLARYAATGTTITIRPVINLNNDLAVDQHDPPQAMRETVLTRDAHCVFPGCRMPAINCDLDHRQPWAHGGPTKTSNLAPLCRHHHNLRHHTNWTHQPLPNGDHQWTSQLGHTYTTSGLPP